MQKTAKQTADTKDFDEGGGIFVPSSFSRIGVKEREKFATLEGRERIENILKDCFGVESDLQLCAGDFPLVEIEDGVFVLELEKAHMFETVKQEFRAVAFAATLVSSCIDIETEGQIQLFLPYVNGTLIAGAAMLGFVGIGAEIYVAADKASIKACETACDRLRKVFPTRKDVNLLKVEKDERDETIKNFSDFDDYVFDTVSALAATAFEYVDEREDEDAGKSIIVSVDSPMNMAVEVLSALGERASDENDAKKKLETLFAIEPQLG